MPRIILRASRRKETCDRGMHTAQAAVPAGGNGISVESLWKLLHDSALETGHGFRCRHLTYKTPGNSVQTYAVDLGELSSLHGLQRSSARLSARRHNTHLPSIAAAWASDRFIAAMASAFSRRSLSCPSVQASSSRSLEGQKSSK